MRGRDVSVANAGTSNSQNNVGKGGKVQAKIMGNRETMRTRDWHGPLQYCKKMVPVLVDLDRRVASLEDRSTFIVVPHPLGGSLRVCILRTCLELMLECLNRQLNVDNTAVQLLNKVLEVSPEKMAEVIFRAKPRHPKSRQDKPWVWAFMFADGLSSTEKSTMSSLYNIRCSEVFVSAQHSQDGPLVRWLRDWRDNSTEDTGEAEDLTMGKTKRKRGLGRVNRQ